MTRRAWFWPALVVTLLAATVVADAVMIWIATTDPSFAVEEDYYRKAVDWDATMETRRKSDALGWSVRWAFGPVDDRGAVEVEATLLDASGAPVEGVRVRVETFHNARAAKVLRADLPSRGDGAYAAILPLGRPGLWELRLRAERGEDRFLSVETEEIPVVP